MAVLTARTTYDLDNFVADMESLLDTNPDQKTLFEKGSSYLEKLILSPGALPEQYARPSGKGRRPNHGSYALYRGPKLFVSSVVWGPGDYVGPHDHQTWGMIGVIGNAIQETRYRRVDDRDKPDFVKLERDRTTLVKPGDVSLLIPEIDEIHRMDNPSDRSTVEIHVYGHDLVGLPRFRYDLEHCRAIGFASDPFDNC
jgi:predicted metal-dependent enzyme (double-stranded beta helix superfamily)